MDINVNQLARALSQVMGSTSSNKGNKKGSIKMGARFQPAEKKGSKVVKNAYVTGYRHERNQGLVSVIAYPYKNTHDTDPEKSTKGITYRTWMAKVRYHRSGVEHVRPALFNPNNSSVFIPSLNMGVLPEGNNGIGWFGTFSKRKG